MDVLNVENELREVVARVVTQVELASKQGRLDINLAMEDAFIPILKELFHFVGINGAFALGINTFGFSFGYYIIFLYWTNSRDSTCGCGRKGRYCTNN